MRAPPQSQWARRGRLRVVNGPENASDPLPNSAYAQELRSSEGRMEFSPVIESQYRAYYLSERRTHARSFYLIMALIAAAAATQLLFFAAAAPDIPGIARLGAIALIFLLLAAITFVARYNRIFLQAASTGCAVISVLASFEVAHHVANGQGEVFAILTTLSLALYYLAGLLFSGAVFANVMLVVSFSTAMVWYREPIGELASLVAFLAASAIIGGLAFRNHGARFRRSFLQHLLIADLASLDGLTGLKNRRALDSHLLRAWQLALRDRRPIGVLLLDVDHFKAFNDRYGHQAGDSALRRIAAVASATTRRPMDLVARYGGEEFALILYDAQPDHVRALAQQLQREVLNLDIEHEDSPPLRKISVSIGVAIGWPKLKRTPQGMIQLADEALYAAKHGGRNCVVIREDESPGHSTGKFRVPGADVG